MSDQDLDLLLAEYRNKEVASIQIQKWKKAVRAQRWSLRERAFKQWIPLAAASIFGFLLGAWAFSTHMPKGSLHEVSAISSSPIEQNSSADTATIEYVYIKSN